MRLRIFQFKIKEREKDSNNRNVLQSIFFRLIAIKETRIQESKEATNQASNLARLIGETFYGLGFSYLQYFAFLIMLSSFLKKKKPTPLYIPEKVFSFQYLVSVQNLTLRVYKHPHFFSYPMINSIPAFSALYFILVCNS